jgi:hypothetical protein
MKVRLMYLATVATAAVCGILQRLGMSDGGVI